jgi:hypothetical protein
MISRALADRLQLKDVDEVVAGDESEANTRTLKLVKIPSLSIGTATFRNLSGLVYDNELGHQRGDEIGGSLGFPLFGGCLVTLDLSGGTLTLAEGELDTGGDNIVPFAMPRGSPEVEIEVGGERVTAILDSGSPILLSLPSRYAETLTLRGKPQVVRKLATLFNEFDVSSAVLQGSIAVGPHRIHDPVLEFNDVLPDPNLGRPFFDRFVITFDFTNRRIRLAVK